MYPLYDGTNRMLVSWAPCLVENTDGTTSVCSNTNTTGANVKLAPPQYTVWVYDFDAGTLSPLLSAEQGIEIVEPIILQARTPTAHLHSGLPADHPGRGDPGQQRGRHPQHLERVRLRRRGYGEAQTFRRRPIPRNASFYTRPARFVRIEKAVEIPPKTVRKINQSAFGPAGMGMREILGYAPVQPDGSVQIQVPANVPFVIDVLDANARRITAQHTSWMQVMPGEIKSCNGCHTAGNLTHPSHGRSGLTVAVNKGAPTTGRALPQYLQRALCEPGRDDGANPRAHQLRDRQRARQARRAQHAAVLPDPGDRRHLRADLDRRRHHAPGRRNISICPTARASRTPRTSEFRARPRPTPTACPGAPSAASRFIMRTPSRIPTQLFIQNLWKTRRAWRPSTAWRTPRDVHQLPQPGESAEQDSSARRTARPDRRNERVERGDARPDFGHFLSKCPVATFRIDA